MPTKIYLATPSQDGNVNAFHSRSIGELRASTIKCHLPVLQYDTDLVRARSRLVHDFLVHTDCTHLLFTDADIEFEVSCVQGMLAVSEDCVSAPYRKKQVDIVFPMAKKKPEFVERKPHALTVAATGLGMTLLTRSMLHRMTEHFRESLSFYDGDHSGVSGRDTALVVALFLLTLEDKQLLGEDYSFYRRWRELDGKTWLYLGAGSPVNHHGSVRFAGQREDIPYIWESITGENLQKRAATLGLHMSKLSFFELKKLATDGLKPYLSKHEFESNDRAVTETLIFDRAFGRGGFDALYARVVK